MMGVSVLSQQDLDALGGQVFGLDPFVVLGLTTAGFGAIGWLAGPFVGGAAFNVLNRRFRGQIAEVSVFSLSRSYCWHEVVASVSTGWVREEVSGLMANCGSRRLQKEKEFYQRVRRYRVDPSSQSFSNPVPDYYGEKIGSVKDYRQWLKDQRAYNKKRQSFV